MIAVNDRENQSNINQARRVILAEIYAFLLRKRAERESETTQDKDRNENEAV